MPKEGFCPRRSERQSTYSIHWCKSLGGGPYKIAKKVEKLSHFQKIIILSTTTCNYRLYNRRGVPFYVAEEAYKVCFSIRSIVGSWSR